MGEKVFTGKVMEGEISDDYLTVNISTNIHEEIKVDGSMAMYVKMQQSKLKICEAWKPRIISSSSVSFLIGRSIS